MKSILVGFVAGILALGLARFAFAPPEPPVHYHANWAVFVDGKRIDLSDNRYMEAVTACAGDQVLPRSRVHMHNNDDDVVHVHHEGVTWGHFLANLGWGVGEDYLMLDDGRRLFANGTQKLKAVVNGMEGSAVRDRLIRSGDRLLLSYGSEMGEALNAQFAQVASNAEEFNQRDDPAGCAGEPELTTWQRLQRAFWK